MTLTRIIIFLVLWYFVGFLITIILFVAAWVILQIWLWIIGTPADRTRAYLRSLEDKDK